MVDDGTIKFLYNLYNLITAGNISASATKTAQNCVFPSPPVRGGTGTVNLTGTFTGSEDATYDIEIINDLSAITTISGITPIGVGNGVMSGVTASGLSAQDFEIELYSLGTETLQAYADILGVRFEAVAIGSPGNGITLSIDAGGLAATETSWATTEQIDANQVDFNNESFDWGGYPLDAGGNMDPTTARLKLGPEPTVFRQWKEYVSGKWVFHLTPPPPRAIPKGTGVKSVSGTYIATLTDGVTTETYSNIVTIYDLLSQIITTSTIVRIVGVVAEDRTPGGIASIDLPLRTASFNLPLACTGSEYITNLDDELIELDVAADAPTEIVSLKCIDNTVIGQEEFSVEGSLSGLRETRAIAGQQFTDPEGIVDFKIPSQSPPTQTNRFRVKSQTYTSRTGGDLPPPICVPENYMKLGPAATEKTLTLVWQIKPAVKTECECTDVQIGGQISDACLGTAEEWTEMGDITHWLHKLWLDTIYAWKDTFISGNIDLSAGSGDIIRSVSKYIQQYTATLGYDRVDIYVAQRICDMFHDTLDLICSPMHPGNTAENWLPNHTYSLGACVKAVGTPSTYYFVCTAAGMTGAIEPTWTNTIGVEKTSGAAHFTCMGVRPIENFSKHWTDATSQLSVAAGVDYGDFWRSLNIESWEGETIPVFPTLTLLPLGDKFVPTVDNGFYYQVSTEGTSGAAEPTWPEYEGAIVVSGTARLTAHRIELLTINDQLISPQDMYQRVEWFLSQFEAKLGQTLVSADINPPFVFGSTGSSSSTGPSSPCYQDQSDSAVGWWVVNQGEYLPVYNNYIYYTCKSRVNPDTGQLEYYATREARFAIAVKCESDLRNGDTIVLEIDGIEKAYAINDQILIELLRRSPVVLAGGQNGDDTLRWRVTGSLEGPITDHQLIRNSARLTIGPIGGGGDHAFHVGEVVTGGTSGATGEISFVDPFHVYIDCINVSGAFTAAENITTPDTDVAWVTNASLPIPYTWSSGAKTLSFLLGFGAIAAVLGDKYRFSIEAGQFRWRKNSGAWSGAVNIQSTVALSDGLSASFSPGPAPSFLIGDLYQFRVEQKNAPSHTVIPNLDSWKPGVTNAYLESHISGLPLDLANNAFAMAHNIPRGASLMLQGSPDGFTLTAWSIPLTWRDGLIVHIFDSTTRTATHLRLYVNTGGGGSTTWEIYYWFTGQPVNISIPAQKVDLSNQYAMSRGSGLNQAAIYLGKSKSGTVQWHQFLKETDTTKVLTMFDWVKQQNDQPVIWCPHYLRPELARLVTIEDMVMIDDVYNYQQDAELVGTMEEHHYGLKMDLKGVVLP